MPCNAWNHAADCDCGWGGQFYASRGRVKRPSVDSPTYWLWADSYTIPNAHCPHCKASVYFYQSPLGGRVYFDELGPPWPKHPCTDHSAATGSGRVAVPRARSDRYARAPSQQKPQWRPLFCCEVRKHPEFPEIVILSTVGPAGTSDLYAKTSRLDLHRSTPFYVRPCEARDGVFQVSTLSHTSDSLDDLVFVAFRDLNDARRDVPLKPGDESADLEQ